MDVSIPPQRLLRLPLNPSVLRLPGAAGQLFQQRWVGRRGHLDPEPRLARQPARTAQADNSFELKAPPFVGNGSPASAPIAATLDVEAGISAYFKSSTQINLADVRFGTSDNALQNIELHYGGKLAMVNLKAQADFQMGTAKATATGAASDSKYKGMQGVVQGNVGLDPVTINFLVGYGTGNKAGSNDTDAYVTFLDIDPHYTFLYEYKIAGPCGIHTGFCNTTAIGAGVSYAAAKSLSVGLDAFFLQATEKVADKKNGTGTTSDLGTEVDLKLKWKLYDNLAWNWDLGYFLAGAGMGKDDAMGAQGILTFNF